MLTVAQLEDNNAGIGFPQYTAIGFLHIYLQSEDNSPDLWPRSAYREGDNNGGGGHDEL